MSRQAGIGIISVLLLESGAPLVEARGRLHETVAQYRHTCIACPDQYEGITHDGRVFYLRYRFGKVRLGFGSTLELAVNDCFEQPPFLLGDGEWEGQFEDDAQRDWAFREVLKLRGTL